ncbi:MAG TPA: Rieske (2Fe-2S) protein [Limnobacter sp.]|uniref:Rieske (2Fe-2S) protein n=1 Tax=Limnobacter sp. TaxID=2003368 RepID=UPI002ED987B9
MTRIRVCSSDAIQEGGIGYRFKVHYNGEETSAFVVRVDNEVRSFLNRCSHVPVEMDWNYGEFLDDSGRIIVCATHGASYDATDGNCLGGPCLGNPLVRLNVSEQGGEVFWQPSDTITVPPEGIED